MPGSAPPLAAPAIHIFLDPRMVQILLHFLDFKGHILIFVIKYISDTGKLSFHGNCTNELHMLLNQCLKFAIVLAIFEKEIFSGHILLIGTVQ